ncbi:MAG: hypothetical protein MI919_32790, partial [Holophagales bacterium]|nr:hypothetical protein [Holophagales bacterium]
VPDQGSRWVAARGFLEGAAGAGLGLLGAISPVEPDWDRVLMTSIRPLDPDAPLSPAAAGAGVGEG